MTYEEWVSNQDQNGLEFKMVQEVHKIYPSWDLNDIRTYLPTFISLHMKMVNNVHKDDPTLNIQDIEKRISNYIVAGVNGNKIHEATFGDTESCDDYHYLAKWNVNLCKIMQILTHGTKYKAEDDRGHASVHSFKFNGYTYGFRSEMELDRDIKEIVELNRERFGTKSDFFKELIFKGVAIYSMINNRQLGDRARDILTDVDKFERKGRSAYLKDLLEDMESEFEERYNTLRDIEHDRDSLEEFRDDIVTYISDELSRNRSKQDMTKIKSKIMDDRNLSRILNILEKEDLVSEKYVDSIFKKGVSIPYIDIIAKEDVKNSK